MDWTAAIGRNREALKRVLAMLVAMAGLGGASTSPLRGGRREASGGGSIPTMTPTRQSDDCRPPLKGEVGAELTLPRRLHRAVLRLLRPAEAAARRLVIVAARGIVVPVAPQRRPEPTPPPTPGQSHMKFDPLTGLLRKPPLPRSTGERKRRPQGLTPLLAPTQWGRGAERSEAVRGHCRPYAPSATRTPSLPLFDRLRPFRPARPAAGGVPRISVPGFSAPFPVPVRRPLLPGDPIDARPLMLRLEALASALDDLPAQARRFARWRAGQSPIAANAPSPSRFARHLSPTPWGRGGAPSLAAGASSPPCERERAPSLASASSPPSSGGEVVGEADRSGGRSRNAMALRARVAHDGGTRHGRTRRRFRRVWPLRPGRPPGWRRRPTHEVHEILNLTHGLALWALERPDTS
jgi:hypothetical protein